MKYLTLLFIPFFTGLIISCSNTSSPDKQAPDSGSGKTARYRIMNYHDAEGTGLDAFSFLMPAGWKFEGGMHWVTDNPAMPAVTAFRVFNPEGKEEFEVFANHSYFWTTNQQLLGMFPPGSRYFGSFVQQPTDAVNALKSMIIPAERENCSNLKILKEENLPELPAALGAGKQSQYGPGASGAKVRIQYSINQTEMEEEFYAVVEPVTFPVQSMLGTTYNTIWYVDYIFSFKANKGKLESHKSEFQTITSSFRINPKWYAKYSNVIEYMAQQQIRQIQNVGEFSRMLGRMSDQMSSEQLQQFESRSDVYDKVSEKFSDNMLGIDRYFDPHEGRQVELPSGYGQAWANNNGEYILSDNPNFNPNEGSNLHWELMERK